MKKEDIRTAIIAGTFTALLVVLHNIIIYIYPYAL